MRDDDDEPDGDYKVGYGRPPKHTRFKPGQSGNPRGRKRKSKELNQLIDAELDKWITVTEDGKEKRIRKRDGLVTLLVNRGLKGDPKSLQILIAHLEKHREVEPFTPTEADDAALLAALSAPDKKEDDHGDR